MNPPLFTGRVIQPPASPVALPAPDRKVQSDPAGYLPDSGLVDAVNVALTLSQPLLLTGEPGTGKTELARRIAWELGLGEVLRFDTKSTSTARDLFYTFDALGRFHAAHSPQSDGDNRTYLTYNALGEAILRANDVEAVKHLLPSGFKHGGRQRAVVLIDEVDKAPRDFPNDLLNEVDQLSFRITELKNAEVRAETAFRPVLIITSNSEKNLPDPFLRRCVYYHIPFPNEDRLAEIVHRRLPTFRGASDPLLKTAIEFFLKLRESGVRKKPSTAELINWLNVLSVAGASPGSQLSAHKDLAARSLSAIVKTDDDIVEARNCLTKHLGAT